ncbi:MAG: hypothetical protein O6940_02970, partial [Ignavibacteria bacterium]|nr:hypothetical protein [Ignavibacteria bacterium]
MPGFFNLKGYTALDPLDKASTGIRYTFLIAVNFLLSVILIYLITKYNIVLFNGFTMFGFFFPPIVTMTIEVIINTFIYSAIIILLRKSSSVIIYLVVFLPYYLLDLYLESYVRDVSQNALWIYGDPSAVSWIKIPALKFFVTISVDAIIFGILALFLARLLAMVIYKKKNYPNVPNEKEYRKLFSKEWSQES